MSEVARAGGSRAAKAVPGVQSRLLPSETPPTAPPGRHGGPIAPEGWPIVLAFLIGALLLIALAQTLLGVAGGAAMSVVCLVLVVWCVWFFRDPERQPPADPNAVVSAADGVVCLIDKAAPPAELGLPGDAAGVKTRVCVFMNVFNVHVNRSPAAGRIVASAYRPGKFFNASFDKASEHNERSSFALEMADGRVMTVVQIAGLVARRIVSHADVGRALVRGERFGIIRFGSRVDIYLPEGVEPAVKVGDKTTAGETVLARIVTPAGGGAAEHEEPLFVPEAAGRRGGV